MKTFLATHPLYQSGDATVDLKVDIPENLKTMLRQVDTNSYANGFFRFVSPPTFGQYLELFKLDPFECHTFLKCGFGHLIFYHQGQYKALNPVVNEIDVLGDASDLDFVMDIALCDRPGLENSFFLDVYEQAFPRLGAPGIDEMYAFVPALKLGGNRNAANVRKSKMEVEMRILSQL